MCGRSFILWIIIIWSVCPWNLDSGFQNQPCYNSNKPNMWVKSSFGTGHGLHWFGFEPPLSFWEDASNRQPSISCEGCVCMFTLNHVWLFAILWTVGTKFPSPQTFPGKNTGVGCHFLLQRIFPTQESNPWLLCLLHCKWILYHWAIREAIKGTLQHVLEQGWLSQTRTQVSK